MKKTSLASSNGCEARTRERSTRRDTPPEGELFQPDLSTAEEWMELAIRAYAQMVEFNPAVTSDEGRLQSRVLADMLRYGVRETVKILTTTGVIYLRDAYNEMKADKTEVKEALQ